MDTTAPSYVYIRQFVQTEYNLRPRPCCKVAVAKVRASRPRKDPLVTSRLTVNSMALLTPLRRSYVRGETRALSGRTLDREFESRPGHGRLPLVFLC